MFSHLCKVLGIQNRTKTQYSLQEFQSKEEHLKWKHFNTVKAKLYLSFKQSGNTLFKTVAIGERV